MSVKVAYVSAFSRLEPKMKRTSAMRLFYRQKVLLGVLQAFGGSLTSLNLQKYLFLFSAFCQKEKSYEFVPYKYGCFSFQSYADRKKLVEQGILCSADDWTITSDDDFLGLLEPGDRRKIELFADKYRGTKGNALVREVYRKYPYFAIKSEIAGKLMTDAEQKEIEAHKPSVKGKALYTIGYEGNSFENYLNRLITNDIRLLVDVRKNPLSRKYGFSKRTLSETLEKLGVAYLHMPELGIVSEKRRELKSQRDYDMLFDEYEDTVLKENDEAVAALIDLVEKQERIAITCFEAEVCMCHRGRVAKAVEQHPDWQHKVLHI